MFNEVNAYCLNRIVQLAESREVVAAHDICDDRGTKLLAAGKRVSAELRQRLLMRKLAKPLEMALSVEDSLTLHDVGQSCFEYLDRYPLARAFAGNADALALLRALQKERLAPSVSLLLTAVHQHSPDEYAHNVATILLAVGLASRLRASDRDSMCLMLAGLLHDFGVLYVNPELIKQPHLHPRDWKYVAAHPMIGKMLIREMTTLPPLVAELTAQHHERMDGSGYPNHLGRGQIQRLGGWLAVADSVSAIMMRGGDEAPARIALALRVIPEEFDREAVSSVITAMRGMESGTGAGDATCFERAEREMERIESALGHAREVGARSREPMAAAVVHALEITLGNVAKSLRATGVLDAKAQLAADIGDPELLAEMNQITHEVGWRMRNLARNIYMRAEAQGAHGLLVELQQVIDLLDGGHDAVPASSSPASRQDEEGFGDVALVPVPARLSDQIAQGV